MRLFYAVSSQSILKETISTAERCVTLRRVECGRGLFDQAGRCAVGEEAIFRFIQIHVHGGCRAEEHFIRDGFGGVGDQGGIEEFTMAHSPGRGAIHAERSGDFSIAFAHCCQGMHGNEICGR